MNVTDLEVRKAIAQTITDALTSYYSASATPVAPIVKDRWMLSFTGGVQQGISIATMKATTGLYAGKVHGWMVGSDGLDRSRPEAKVTGNAMYQRVGPERRDVLRNYKVWSFHQFDKGDEDDSSEIRLANEIEFVADWFSKNPMLTFTNNNFKGHKELQFPNIELFNFVGDVANVAQGTLQIITYRQF